MLSLLLLVLSIVLIIFLTNTVKLHPFLALLAASLFFGLSTGLSPMTIIETINAGFGSTIGSIGIVIIAGLIIGTFLEKSGGAYALANVVLRLIGPKRVHSAMAMMGAIVGVPVFADSGFIILSPLNKALTKKAGLSLAGTAIALSIGVLATHTMVPPTPGPIAAAGILGADLGLVILIGLGTSLCAMMVAIQFAKRQGNRIQLDPEVDVDEEVITARTEEAPSAFKSFLPIVLPILLIVLRSIADYPGQPFGDGSFAQFILFIGHPAVALLLGMLVAFTLPKRLDRAMLSTSGWVGEALTSAAVIILITGAGGAFGKVLQSSDLNTLLQNNVANLSLGIWVPFFIAAIIKTAQGSSTVAIITTASILAPLLPGLGLDDGTSRAMTVVAIGAGSAMVSHANDSFFWVVTQMSGMDVKQGYRLHSLGTIVLGLSAMLVLSIISLLI